MDDSYIKIKILHSKRGLARWRCHTCGEASHVHYRSVEEAIKRSEKHILKHMKKSKAFSSVG